MMKTSGYDHAIRALAFDDVLALLAQECVNIAARDAVLALRPSPNTTAIRERLAETDEYRALREQVGDIHIPDTGYRETVKRIAQGERGDASALRRIADGENAVRELRRGVIDRKDTSPLLATIAAGSLPNETFVRDAYKALDAEGQVRDEASPELKRIRRDIQAAKSGLRE
ncbi:MAG TPA: hypothetical protein VF247_10580, partial [Candidatus Krumholzibacteria bacterium]